MASPGFITVNALAPGYVPSKMSAQLGTYMGENDTIKKIPLGVRQRLASFSPLRV